MQIEITPKAKEHLLFWQKTGNKAVLKKIEQITEAILEDAYEGVGKPEALKHDLTGKWFRRIKEYYYTYEIRENTLLIFSLKSTIYARKNGIYSK